MPMDKPLTKRNGKVANNQATKDPVMPTNFLSHPSLKAFDPKDINPNFDKAEDAENINDKDWDGLEDNDDNGTTQDNNDQAQQATFLSFLFFVSSFFFFLLFLLFPSLVLPKIPSTSMDKKQRWLSVGTCGAF